MCFWYINIEETYSVYIYIYIYILFSLCSVSSVHSFHVRQSTEVHFGPCDENAVIHPCPLGNTADFRMQHKPSVSVIQTHLW